MSCKGKRSWAFLSNTISIMQMSTQSFHHPVATRWTPTGIETTGLDWDDYLNRMSTHQHVLAPGRRFATPTWAVNDGQLRELLVRNLELRAGLRLQREGTLAERLARAEKALHEKRPGIEAELRRLCARYVDIKRHPQPDSFFVEKELEILISNRDTQLRVIDGGAARIICGVVYHFYRRGLNALQVAEELGLKHCHVRQILWRLHEDWRNLKGIEPERLIARPRKFWSAHSYTVDDDSIYILRERGLSQEAIARRLSIPVFEVPKALQRIRKGHNLALEVRDTVHDVTGEMVTVKNLPKRAEAVRVPAPSTRYTLYVEFCKRLGQEPMSEKLWNISNSDRTTNIVWLGSSA
jgi:hypothetical protein